MSGFVNAEQRLHDQIVERRLGWVDEAGGSQYFKTVKRHFNAKIEGATWPGAIDRYFLLAATDEAGPGKGY